MQKGITREIIFKESEKLIKSHGIDNFSVRLLSNHLGIKPASLYNHINGIDEIYNYIAKKAADMMVEKLRSAIDGKEPDEAFVAAAKAYRHFAETKREYYLMLIKIRSSKNEETARLGLKSFRPFAELIRSYGMPKSKTINFIRIFRSFMHGFVEITYNGFMQKGPVPKDETFDTAVNEFLRILKEGQEKCEDI